MLYVTEMIQSRMIQKTCVIDNNYCVLYPTSRLPYFILRH